MRRFYVTMTWHDFPEGGSFATIVKAEGHNEAEQMCREEMAKVEEDECQDAADRLANYGDEWVVIDCFDLDKFIAFHALK